MIQLFRRKTYNSSETVRFCVSAVPSPTCRRRFSNTPQSQSTMKWLWLWAEAIWMEGSRKCVYWTDVLHNASKFHVVELNQWWDVPWISAGEFPTKASQLHSCDEQTVLLLTLLKRFNMTIHLVPIYMLLSILSCLHHFIVLMTLLFFIPLFLQPKIFRGFIVKINNHGSCSLQGLGETLLWLKVQKESSVWGCITWSKTAGKCCLLVK